MEYEMQDNEYTLEEFYTLYKDKLPTVVMVSQGFSGDRLEETFESGQVIRVHCVFRQQRVIAVRLDERGNEERTYSFPVDYPIPFCLREMHNPNELLTLAEILDKSDLPVDVKFARKQIIKIGDNISSTSRLVNLRLTNVFDEICLLGNFIFDEIAVYKPNGLSKLVCSARDKKTLIYENFYPEMYTNISELIDPSFKSKAANAVDDGLYEPLLTSSAGKDTIKTADGEKIAHSTNQSKTKYSHDVVLYETIVMVPAGKTNSKTKDRNLNQNQRSTHNKDHGKSSNVQKQLVCELTDRFEKGLVSTKRANSSDKPSIISPKPKLNRHVSEPRFTGQQPVEVVPSEVVPCFRPSTPTLVSSQSKQYRKKALSTSFDNYENVTISISELNQSTYPKPCVTLCELNTVGDEQFKSLPSNPQRIEGDDTKTVDVGKLKVGEQGRRMENTSCNPQRTEGGNNTKTINVGKLKVGEQGRRMEDTSCNPQRTEGGDDTKTVNVGTLKVGELGGWMEDKLRLGKYVARFAEELVDGALLVDLNENLLKEEFGFSPMEAKRLMKFAKEGHVPQ
ncbi:hypothetical protein ACJMK2_003887 [Sinanodonta woodiana]|uniref:SAM domain-containing protein n=1 Tax=Sinanodonta woodiana TaxID=1069815 RepID=A0ABD3XZJ0_SINWO